MSGWVKNHRSITDWEWYKTENMAHLFQHLIREANHEDRRWQGIEVKRGQLITGRKILAEQTGISEQSVRTCLDRLKSTSEITIKVTNRYSVITICNYDIYQTPDGEANQQINQPVNQQSTNNQPATNHKQEEEEVKEVKKKRIKKDKEPSLFEKTDEKTEYAPFVRLTAKEYNALLVEYGQLGVDWMLQKLSAYKESVGKKYKSDAAAIKVWVVKSYLNENPNGLQKFVP